MHILVVGRFGQDIRPVVREDRHAGQLRFAVKHGDDIGRQCLFKQDLACLDVNDFPSVEGEDETAVLLQLEFVGQRDDTVRGPSGSERDVQALLLGADQYFFRERCNFLLAVRQCAVQIQYK